MLRAKLDYSCRDGIGLNREAVGVATMLRQAAVAVADDVGLVDEAELRPHIPSPEWERHLPALLSRSGLHRVGGRLSLRASNRARFKAALLRIGRPATKEEIAVVAGLESARAGSALSTIASVVRADKHRWGLTEWIDDPYEGIAAAIARRIDDDGGETPLESLVEDLPRRFGVSASSVRTFVSSPKFVLSGGQVRLRRPDEPFSVSRPEVRHCRSTFALGPRRVGLLLVVDHETLRGSGRTLSAGAASIIDLAVNETMRFRGPGQTVVNVRWSETSAGPTLGSMRGLAATVGAKRGDLLSVVLDANDATVTATATSPADHSPGWPLVARLTGIDKHDGIPGLARALGCSPGEARAVLRRRGDTLILHALPAEPPAASVTS